MTHCRHSHRVYNFSEYSNSDKTNGVLKRSNSHKRYPPQVQHPLRITTCTSSRGQPSLSEHSLQKQGFMCGCGDVYLFRISLNLFSSNFHVYHPKTQSTEENTNHLRYYCTAYSSTRYQSRHHPFKDSITPHSFSVLTMNIKQRIFFAPVCHQPLRGAPSHQAPRSMAFPDIDSFSQLPSPRAVRLWRPRISLTSGKQRSTVTYGSLVLS